MSALYNTIKNIYNNGDYDIKKLIIFSKEEIDILKNKNISYISLNNIKLFKNIFGGVVVS